MPTNATESRIAEKLWDLESISNPASVELMPMASEYGCGRRSVYIPITGCKSDAVACIAKLIIPICPKSRL